MKPSSAGILVVANPGTAQRFAGILPIEGVAVDTADSLSAASRQIKTRQFGLVICDLVQGTVSLDQFARFRAEAEHLVELPPMLLLVDSPGSEMMESLFRQQFVNLLAVSARRQLDPLEFKTTVLKYITGDIFGIGRYLKAGAQIRRIDLLSSVDKLVAIETAVDFALQMGLRPRIADNIGVATDELLTNALYNAPITVQGQHRYAHYSRRTPVRLQADEKIHFSLGYDGTRFALAVKDPFGSLDVGALSAHLAKCFAQQHDPIAHSSGGAGLGLYYLYQLVHHTIINVQTNAHTEVIGILNPTKTYRQYSDFPRSFTFFSGK